MGHLLGSVARFLGGLIIRMSISLVLRLADGVLAIGSLVQVKIRGLVGLLECGEPGLAAQLKLQLSVYRGKNACSRKRPINLSYLSNYWFN